MFDSLFQRNRAEFQVFINHMNDAIYVMEVTDDGTFKYLVINEAGMEQADIGQDAIGKTLEEVLPKEKSTLIEGYYTQVLDKKKPIKYVYKDGGYAESILTPIFDSNNNIRHILSVTRDITKRKLMEYELEKNKQIYESLFQQNTDAVYSIDLEGILQTVNRAWESLTGYSIDEILYTSFSNFIAPEYLEKAFIHYEKSKKGEPQEYEIQLIHKSGYLVDCLVKNIPIFIDGEIIGVYGIAKDITEEKRIYKAIRESEERFSNLLDYSPDANFIHVDEYIVYANQAANKLLGVSEGELIGKSIFDFYPFKSRGIVVQHLKEFRENGESLGLVEEKIININGKEIDVEVSRIQTNYKGKLGIHAVVRNISERKRLEKALKVSEEKYRLITESSRDLIQLIGKNRITVYASPSHAKILGHSAEYYVNNKFEDIVYDESRNEFIQEFQNVLQTHKHSSMEVRVLHGTGHWFWLHFDLIPILDEDGNLENILLVGEDITDRKKYQEQIHQMAFHDALTGLPNRRLFNESIEQSISLAKRTETKVAILYLDCDNFKPVNDKLGHDAGDEFLQIFAKRLKESVRECDVVSRIGGDEFVILLTNIENKEDVNDVAARIRQNTIKPWEYKEHSFQVTASIGLAIYPNDGVSAKALLNHADKALYKAKEKGKNTIEWYSN
ncbi:diguanylate cyclase (GGDEF)-like protein/PAS domain S-box-containing protein [Evansella vedderi]|uniref:Diguanylate cyclase (GGDEF)-like protein/PAS domain S-box-containing protein n=1 Tax=Evansella vedderi TaxID=38282 RepID=A0ABT9ZWR8_9BACI|nr:PAS domain S-box protein [Evansella vedderi]MDQ0255676.1 diguanylate cyclase (GGDEF)-like protein/PAS domain S-box-containing protein [Evansella vedderi]